VFLAVITHALYMPPQARAQRLGMCASVGCILLLGLCHIVVSSPYTVKRHPRMQDALGTSAVDARYKVVIYGGTGVPQPQAAQ
jgi:hypothetical protein